MGGAIGILVNVLVLPPLRDHQANRYVDSINQRMGAVLADMSQEFSESWDTDRADAWLAEAQSMSDELNSAWQMVKVARESRRKNPRRLLHRTAQTDDDVDYEHVLNNIAEGISHLRNMTRTMRQATWAVGSWDEHNAIALGGHRRSGAMSCPAGQPRYIGHQDVTDAGSATCPMAHLRCHAGQFAPHYPHFLGC